MSNPLLLVVRVTRWVTIVGATAGILAMVKLTGRVSALWSPLTASVLLPFVLVLVTLARRPSSIVGALALAGSGAFGLVTYLDLLLPASRPSSTAGLVMVFGPQWQSLVCLAAVAVSVGLDFINARTRAREGGSGGGAV